MPARDIFHQQVKHALEKDGWQITHDPYWIKLMGSDMNAYADLAAERILAAEKGNEKIAVEIKSFLGTSSTGAIFGLSSRVTPQRPRAPVVPRRFVGRVSGVFWSSIRPGRLSRIRAHTADL